MHCDQLAASLQRRHAFRNLNESPYQYGHVKCKILTYFFVTYVIHLFVAGLGLEIETNPNNI